MKLRKLRPEDAPLMLEWMHDKDCVGKLQTDFMSKTETDCLNFIRYAQDCQSDLHLAIADDNDTYMGTVSLKHIDRDSGCAEFAIAIRACAMGTGLSAAGMEAILQLGLDDGLSMIYWCVSPENHRAVRFYDKHNYPRIGSERLNVSHYTPQQIADYIWYAVTK